MWYNNNYCSVVDLLGLVFVYYMCTSCPMMFAIIFVLDLDSTFSSYSLIVLGSVLIVEGILCHRFVYTCMYKLQCFQAWELFSCVTLKMIFVTV